MTCGRCRFSSIRARQQSRRLLSKQDTRHHNTTTSCSLQHHSAHLSTIQRRRVHLQAAKGSAPPPGEIDYSTVNVEELEPVPIMDQNIKPGQGDESVGEDYVTDSVIAREEEAWTRREGYLSYFFGADENKELLIRQCPERQLDLGEVYVLDYETDKHATPKISGTIVKGACNYQVIPVETFVSGNAFEGVEEKHLLQHLLMVKVASEDPHTLDFTHTYCFNCVDEELYRVSFVPIRDPSTIEDPVLRFQPENNFFILDSKDTMPSPMLINLKHEADDLGANFDVDLYSGLTPPESATKKDQGSDDDSDTETIMVNAEPATSRPPSGDQGKDGVLASDVVADLAGIIPDDGDDDDGPKQKQDKPVPGSGQSAVEAAVAEEESAGEETSSLTTGTEIDTDDTPDVPAVDLA